ncbi:MAG: ABC transporter permease [Clostridiales bacterium]|nr:ABC transporter permease [Clostridiales bacterium]
MKVNPVLKKELMLGSRTIRFPIALMCYGLCMAAISLLMVFSAVNVSGAADFANLTSIFLVLAFVQMGLILLIIPVLTAGSIAGERERQTLDLLLTAPVSSFSVILGKLLSSMCNVLLYIFVSLPAMAMAFLYGGIQWRYLAVFLVMILVTAFFCGAVSIWCAAQFKKTILSIVVSLLWEFVFFGGTLIMVVGVYSWRYLQWNQAVAAGTLSSSSSVSMGWIPVILLLNPAVGFADAMSSTYSSVNLMNQILNGGSLGTLAQGLIRLSPHWSLFGFAVTVAVGMLFLVLAARKLNTARKKDKFFQPAKKKGRRRA